MAQNIAGVQAAQNEAGTEAARRIPALLGLAALGAVILYGVLLSPMAAAHNAAHDTRHVMVAPCH